MQADFLPLSHYLCFPKPLDIKEFWSMRQQYLLSASLIRDQSIPDLSDYKHPEESTLSLVLSLRVDRRLWRESHATHAPSVSSFPSSLSSRKAIVACMFMHGSSEQAIGVLLQCHTYTVSPAVRSSSCWYVVILQYQNPERVLLNTIHSTDE